MGLAPLMGVEEGAKLNGVIMLYSLHEDNRGSNHIFWSCVLAHVV